VFHLSRNWALNVFDIIMTFVLVPCSVMLWQKQNFPFLHWSCNVIIGKTQKGKRLFHTVSYDHNFMRHVGPLPNRKYRGFTLNKKFMQAQVYASTTVNFKTDLKPLNLDPTGSGANLRYTNRWKLVFDDIDAIRRTTDVGRCVIRRK